MQHPPPFLGRLTTASMLARVHPKPVWSEIATVLVISFCVLGAIVVVGIGTNLSLSLQQVEIQQVL
jgi:hypothetical protein